MRNLFPFLPAWCLLVECTSATPLTYTLGPITLISSEPPHVEVHVVTGTITTNGKFGRLTGTDFVDWSISVEGTHLYHFHPGNPGAQVNVGWVDASLTEITTQGHFGELFVIAYDNKVSDCSACRQTLKWSGWGFGHLTYSHFDTDSMPSSQGYMVVEEMPFVIASRVVPEPPCWLAAIFGMAILICACHGRKSICHADSVTA